MIQEHNGELWVVCPVCKLRLQKIWSNTALKHFPVFCRRCRKVVCEINI